MQELQARVAKFAKDRVAFEGAMAKLREGGEPYTDMDTDYDLFLALGRIDALERRLQDAIDEGNQHVREFRDAIAEIKGNL